ncbi:MAG: TolB family protein, partial [Polyangia bacterium]
MLRRAATGLALVLAAFVAADARAQDDDVVQRPERMTAGVSDQLLGQLAPGGRMLYFVSNRNTINELYRQEQASSGAKLLFDEGADVTWPRVSPDGKRILYISFHDDASGRLCVRDLPDRKRRCWEDAGSALQAQWIDNGRIALVSRDSVQGDLRLILVDVGRKLSGRTLVQRNLTSPAVSPDGRWIVYVPVQRYVERVGPGFAARAAARLAAMRLDRPGDPPQPLALDLPGLTGQP